MVGLIEMVVFDMDGVLTSIDSSWQTLHRVFGVNNEENLKQHLQNEIDYKEFMRTDISLWGKTNIQKIKNILDQVPLIKGSRETLECIRKKGLKTAIISSGISILAERLKDELGIDYVFANRLLTDEKGNLLGEAEEVVTLKNKGLVLEKLCKEKNIAINNCAIVGESKFDVPMFKKAGLSIAFISKDSAVKEAADLVIDKEDLRKILPWIIAPKGAKTEISLYFQRENYAKIIVKAIAPDNFNVPSNLIIKSYLEENNNVAKTRVFCIKRLGTMLATLDDLLCNILLAEKTLKTLDNSSCQQTF